MVVEDNALREPELGEVQGCEGGSDAVRDFVLNADAVEESDPDRREHPEDVIDKADGLVRDASRFAGDLAQNEVRRGRAKQHPHRVGLEDNEGVLQDAQSCNDIPVALTDVNEVENVPRLRVAQVGEVQA